MVGEGVADLEDDGEGVVPVGVRCTVASSRGNAMLVPEFSPVGRKQEGEGQMLEQTAPNRLDTARDESTWTPEEWEAWRDEVRSLARAA